MNFPTETLKEGKIKILVPKLEAFAKKPSDYAPSKAPVFFNPIMELNRDLAGLALQAYQRLVDREISVCEPLAGCGVRGIRFAAEVKGVKKVLINDINANAFKLAKHNVQMNKLEKCVTVKNEDANLLLAHYGAPRRRFDAIDIDPFGSPVPYLDSAIRALRNDGLLALTATDMAPLCGVHPRACVRKYGGKPLRTEYCHEIAIRLLAGCLATTAAKYDISMRVLFSHSTHHYSRIYARTNYGAKKADETIKNMGYILHCFKCFHRENAKKVFHSEHSGKCSECNSKLSFAGPLWLGRISDKHFCELIKEEARHKALKQGGKIRKILALIRDEAEAPITYYVIDKLSERLALPGPSVKTVIEALKDEGFQAYLTHFNPKGIRTDAPSKNVMKILQVIN
ncbi:MAG: tRNA (guanine(10)-N(2))-dimethyltransferase [Candidatus Bathyarchaeota archaeon]|nr:tRNA (guanine(10)-N(2))-dimethyltransferase [Candidatus Bathyarchaeota archaeon]MDH5787710.1 tRNA (guanine(10)-N(2))-dimethyltransferase [Candidatus Bathyarchaeota archaeon]